MDNFDEIRDVRLSNDVTVGDYLKYEDDREKKRIAKFIRDRFEERYIIPAKAEPKNGFAIMALSCLMIEALESFRNGWENTRNKSREAFESFFKYAKENNLKLGIFYEAADDFYENVRCGLLHQAETTNGWRILRKGDLYNKSEKIINATKFLNGIEEYLHHYYQTLMQSDWDSEVWKNLRNKMKAIIKNCETREVK